ncbi:MAG: hypothetical protein H7A23_03385 [Leptospiraceae bacterium]|nr:hypothetical protein [Leptospiraceae bacterium]
MKVFKQLIYTLVFITVVAGCTPNAISFNNDDDKKKDKDKNNLLLLGLLVLSQDQAITMYTGSMNTSRAGMYRVRLNNGKALVAGGFDSIAKPLYDAELYDPDTEKFSTVNVSADFNRSNIVLLSSGKILYFSNREINENTISPGTFDPETNTITKTGDMIISRVSCGAILLKSGKVLVVGGLDSSGNILSSAELYDPDAGTFSSTGNMNVSRRQGNYVISLILLEDGRVLVASGDGRNKDLSSGLDHVTTMELYDPETGTFTTIGLSSNYPAYSIGSNKVLCYGNSTSDGTNLVVYDVTTGEFSNTNQFLKYSGGSTKLNNGKILFVGGLSSDNKEVYSALQIFDPDTLKVMNIGKMKEPRFGVGLTVLQNGKVLIMGGTNKTGPRIVAPYSDDLTITMYEINALSTAEIYSP